MKKKTTYILLTVLLLLGGSVCAFAEGSSPGVAESFFACTPLAVLTAATVILSVLALIFKRRLEKRLRGTGAKGMLNAFIVFFVVNGIACLVFALMSDGETWLHMMHTPEKDEYHAGQFWEFIRPIQMFYNGDFSSFADSFTPFSMMIYLLFSFFMPQYYLQITAMVTYPFILTIQNFIFFYFLIMLLCMCIVYRMNRYKLRQNGFRYRDELIAFFTVFSFPTVYCLELGNIVTFAYALVLPFLLFRKHEKKLVRIFSHISLGVAAAIAPYTIIFALVIFSDEAKIKLRLARFFLTVGVFAVLLIKPCFYTGFEVLGTYLSAAFAIPEAPVLGNASMQNTLALLGVTNVGARYAITLATSAVIAVGIFILPSNWQKAAAAFCLMLNIVPVQKNTILIFAFVPLVLMLSEKTHRSTDWLYLIAFALMITPIPEWTYYYTLELDAIFAAASLSPTYSMNELFAPLAALILEAGIIAHTIQTTTRKRRAHRAQTATS